VTADPQAETAAKLMTRASSGIIAVRPQYVAMKRIAEMTLLPQMAGLGLMFAMAVGARPR